MPAFNRLQLSPWYLNTRRLNEYCGGQIPAIAQTSLSRNSAERANGMYQGLMVANHVLKSSKLECITAVYENMTADDYVVAYIWDILNFRNAGKAFSQDRDGSELTYASFEGKIHVGSELVRAYGKLTTDHFYSTTSIEMMKGRKRALIFGRMTLDEDRDIEVHPIIIGDMNVDIGEGWSQSWKNTLRIYPQQIDEFAKIKDIDKVNASDVKKMLAIPEDYIKSAIASIIGEPFVPKDWGGETSDLSTGQIAMNGSPGSAAFIFKGPSVSGPLYPSNMGKRGDQLLRAFGESVDLVVVQHCAKIENTVVRLAEALAANPSNPKRFCILDGTDTFRLLKAYDKLPDKN